MRAVTEVRRRFGLGRKARRGTPGGANGERAAVSGDLELFGLAEIVQTVALGMKTACVSLCHGKRHGKIWFERGATRHAVTDGLYGEMAFYEMMRWTSGRFTIEQGVESEERTLGEDALYLLMEGSRRIDESEQGGARGEPPTVKAPDAPMVLTPEMEAELEAIFADLSCERAPAPRVGPGDAVAAQPTRGDRAAAVEERPLPAGEPKNKLPAEVLALHRDLLGTATS